MLGRGKGQSGPRLCPWASMALVGPSPVLPDPQSRSCLLVRSAGSHLWRLLLESHSQSREKSLIPGGGAAGGDPGARPYPPPKGCRPPSSLDRLSDSRVKPPPPMASGNPTEGVLYRH